MKTSFQDYFSWKR